MALTQQLGELVWKITGDNTDAKKKLKDTEKDAKGFGAKLNSAFNAISFAVIAAGVTKISKELIKAASDADEATNAVNVTFKEASNVIQDYAKNAAVSVGLSSNAYKSLSTVIGAQLKQSGLQIDEVAGQTINLTERAADLASVFNTSVTDATNALGSALRGESEPARRFGINISEAAIESEALATGLIKTKSELTDQIKVQARLAVIYKQSADVAGDFRNTSDGLANASRILESRFEDLKAVLGEELLPEVTETTVKFATFLSDFENIERIARTFSATLAVIPLLLQQITIPFKFLGVVGAASFQLLQDGIAFVQEKLEPFQKTIKAVTDTLKGFAQGVKSFVTDTVGDASEKVGDLTGGFLENNKALKILTDGLVGIGVDAVGEYENALEKILSIFGKIEEKQAEVADKGTETPEEIASAWDVAIGKLNKFLKENEKLIDGIVLGAETAVEGLGAISDLSDAITQKRLDDLDRQQQAALEAAGVAEETEIERIENELQAAKDAGDAQLVAEKETELKRAQIVADFEKKKAELAYKGALTKWRLDIGQSIINTLVAVTQALPNIPLAIATGVIGAIQTGAIAAQKPARPSFAVGTLGVERDMVANVHKDEIILPANLSKEAKEEGVTIAPAGKSSGGVINFITQSKELLYQVMFDDSKNQTFVLSDLAIVRT